MNKSNFYQSGIVTTFTGVLILVLLTLMMFFAIRVGVFEQRVSSSELRQKAAFHAAESGLNFGLEFLRKNRGIISKAEVNGNQGWMSTDPTARRWHKCADVDLENESHSHPCFGESEPSGGSGPSVRQNSYYYSFNESTELPIDTSAVLPGVTEDVSVEALLCILDIVEGDPIPVKGCNVDPASAVGVADGSRYIVTLLARGGADCSGGVCSAEALISEKFAPFGPAAGGNAPSVPLTTKSSFPPSGTAEVVPNPNAGGLGVPISVWMNANTSCSADGSVIDPSSGSWATCEYQEWYGTDSMPDGIACTSNCSCTEAESISYTKSNTDVLGIDLVQDPDFPCDLFEFYFGVARDDYRIVKGYSQIISDCSSLGPNSVGLYWVSGSECRVNSNTQVGSPDGPVMLISAATLTRFNGGAKMYGTLFVTDVEDIDAELESNGTNTVYGSVVVDGQLGSYTGTFQVVWNESTARPAGTENVLGAVPGGWSDFHSDWE